MTPELEAALQVGSHGSRGEESPPLPCCCWCGPGLRWLSGLWAHTAGSWCVFHQTSPPFFWQTVLGEQKAFYLLLHYHFHAFLRWSGQVGPPRERETVCTPWRYPDYAQVQETQETAQHVKKFHYRSLLPSKEIAAGSRLILDMTGKTSSRSEGTAQFKA